MSESRARYSSAPLQDLKRKPPRPPAARPAPGRAADEVSPRSFIFLQVMLALVLPGVFVVALLVRDARLYGAFIAASLLSLGAMALLRAFVPNARRVLAVIHAAMVVVSVFALLVSSPPADTLGTVAGDDLASIFSSDTSASMVEMTQESQALAEEEGQTQAASSEAQTRLAQFMAAWSNKDYASMVAYSSPNWVNAYQNQREAETGIFHLTAIRTPLDYQITDVSGTDSDQTRTITMQATISKNDNREPLKYNFQILMIRSNSEWFVDPNSISSSQVVQTSNAQPVTGNENVVATATAVLQAASQAVRSDTVLFYNQDGGQYYHVDPNCSSIAQKYKPLTATFYYRDVSSDTFKNLLPCATCDAPAR